MPSQLVSIATRSGIHRQGQPTVDTTGHTSHHVVRVVADSASLLRLRYLWNQWMSVPLDACSLLLDAAILLPGEEAVRVTFGGLDTLAVTLDGTSKPQNDSDIIVGTVERGDEVAIRTRLRAASGTGYYGTSWYSGTDTLSWYQDGDHLLDLRSAAPSAPGPAYANTNYCSPASLLGVQA